MSIPMVQGVAAPQDSLEESSSDLQEPFLKGEVQPPAYRDVKFAFVFYLQFVGVVITAIVYGPAAFQDIETENDGSAQQQQNDDLVFHTWSLFTILFVSCLAVILSTAALLTVMMRNTHAVVQISFASAPALLLVTSFLLLVIDTAAGLALLQLAVFYGLISAVVYFCYQRYIPFAASTLQAALEAIRLNKGLYVVSFIGLVSSFATSMVYLFTLTGIYIDADKKGEVLCKNLYPDDETFQDDYQSMCLKDPPNYAGLVILLLLFFWTQQVLQNVVHCTTAGTVGAWWFSYVGDPSWCSPNMTDALYRSLTYSFGSICFGSLLVAILQTLERMARSARRRRDGALLACILECILHYMRHLLEYFNSWAFCYVGLYGYDYLSAGKNVIQLFKTRGWSTFASDRLIFRVLYASQLTIALVSGSAAALVDAAMRNKSMFTDENNADVSLNSHIFAFFVGFITGLVLSGSSLFVVESAARTIIVCFAESPADFQEHHPELCQSMRQGWADVYPDEWSVHDLRFAEEMSSARADTAEKDDDVSVARTKLDLV